ncbi:MAG: nucleotidyl transferase AbiEii/AbiGii toxin family protein [Blastocatellia bacterium]|nr:nucleotidyl transferase AbiEii/AbiGii toxin family protein [Blastocatellia bacterium]
MIDTLFDLSGKVDPVRELVFRDVAQASAALGIPFFVVGACARDLLLDLYYSIPAYRATNDIDLGIRVETWYMFEEVKRCLSETGRYVTDIHRPERLRSSEGVFIDVVPFGGVEDSVTRDIVWAPENSVVMSALGFEEAYRNAINVRVAADLIVSVSSLAGLTLMKLIAWKDRRNAKDAKDLELILSEYLHAGNETRLESVEQADLLEEDKFVSLELTSARLLGRDLALIMTDQCRHVVLELLADTSALASGMASESIEIDEAFESARNLLEAFRLGIIDPHI